MTLADLSLRDLLAAFSAATTTPAGGSASALSSALGVSLLMMTAGLGPPKNGSDEDRAALAAALEALEPLRVALTDAVDRDAIEYQRVVAARANVSRAVDRAQSEHAWQQALQRATDAPLDVMRGSAEALDHAETIAARCRTSARSDVRVAIGLLVAGFEGARSSVEDNLGRIAERAYVDDARAEIERLAMAAERGAGARAIFKSV